MSPHKAIAISLAFASTGETGWDLMRSGNFDIALVDIHLPGVSGLDLSWCYQQLIINEGTGAAGGPPNSGGSGRMAPSQPRETDQQTIIIAFTADQTASMEELKSYGIHDVLHKPVSTRALRHMLHKWLPRDCDRAVSNQALVTLEQPAGLQRNQSGTFAGRVLLVEDDEITRTATDLVFRQLGLHIEVCEDGDEAMAILRRRDFDLLLFDIELPTMSGYALASWYKQMCKETERHVGYVVAVTADPNPEACQQFEIDACLPKPLSTQRVVEALQNYWAKKRSTGSPDASPLLAASGTRGHLEM